MKTPVLLIIFNRSDKAQQVFDSIKIVKPEKLFIAADGPRTNRSEDLIKCEETRKIVEQIDWDCDSQLFFTDRNFGCDVFVPKAIDWFFSNINEGIILEDDCVPNQDFYPFTTELLEKYRDNNKIMMISGNNFQRETENNSYYFSRYANTWGWATWKRAWELFQNELQDLESFIKEDKIKEILPTKKEWQYWIGFFNKIKNGKYTFWDTKWMFSIFNNEGICITPNTNLVKNIGYGEDATHTTEKENSMFLETKKLNFPLTHPQEITIDVKKDLFLFSKNYYRNILQKFLLKLKKYL